MKTLFLLLPCMMLTLTSKAQMKPKPVKPYAAGPKPPEVKVTSATSPNNCEEAEGYFLEIIQQKGREIAAANSGMRESREESKSLENSGRAAFRFVSVMQALACNNIGTLLKVYADSASAPVISRLQLGKRRVESITVKLYKNEYFEEASIFLTGLRACSPRLDSMIVNGVVKLEESEVRRIGSSPNQIIIPVYPKLQFGSSASEQYLQFIDMLMTRYKVPANVLAIYKTKERQQVPAGNEEELTMARKLFILYLHAKYNK